MIKKSIDFKYVCKNWLEFMSIPFTVAMKKNILSLTQPGPSWLLIPEPEDGIFGQCGRDIGCIQEG